MRLHRKPHHPKPHQTAPKNQTTTPNYETTLPRARNMGKVGIPIMGYCFSLAGVWGWERGQYARGKAESVALVEGSRDFQEPIPDGMIWNMRYRKGEEDKFVPETSENEVWERLEFFLNQLIPVVEENNVSLAAHPNDPPLAVLRKTGRVLKNPYSLLLKPHTLLF